MPYSPEEMRRYWRLHSRQWKDLDRSRDPEGLTNVCFSGAPLWINRFSSWCQQATFLALLERLGPVAGLRALDVGCGVGRWSRLLSSRGVKVTGIDLQSETLRINQSLMPDCRFLEMSVDSLGFSSASFDLAVTVTVLQHVPYENHEASMQEIRRVLKKGGALLFLEAIHDRGMHVFANSIEQWQEMAVSAGFRVEAALPYDFAPLLYALKNAAARHHGRKAAADKIPVEEYVARFRNSGTDGGTARAAYRAALRAATLASYPVESLLTWFRPRSLAHHVGLLLRAA